MKKIININLSGRVIPIEDAAYESLQRYIESLRRYFAAEDGRDEIINDIESRIAELMNDKVKKGAAAVTEADTEAIINMMGRVEDFEQVDGNEHSSASAASATGAAAAEEPINTRSTGTRPRGRLYRDTNDKILGGVCSGIAHYFGIDPAIVRIILVLLVFGAGTGIFLYLILWIFVPKRPLETTVSKRFFRNPDDRIIGGVAGGIAAYFNKDAWTIRLIFLAPILLNILFEVLSAIFGGYHGYAPAFVGSFTGTFILAYVILWIILPEASSSFEKMEMRGENVDVHRIRENVKSEMENLKAHTQNFAQEVKDSARNFGRSASDFAGTRGRSFASEVGETARPVARNIGNVIRLILKAFVIFILGCIAFGFFSAIIVFAFTGVGDFTNTFLMENGTQKFLGWTGIILLFGIPFLALVTWVVRRLMKVRHHNRYLGITFASLWVIGILMSALFAGSMIKSFRFAGRNVEQVPIVAGLRKLTVQVNQPAIEYSGYYSFINVDRNETGWDVNDDTMKLSNVKILVEKSIDSQYHVSIEKVGNGGSRSQAQLRADKINYAISAQDSVLNLASGFAISKHEKFRNQRVLVRIQVPVGRSIRFDASVRERLNPMQIHISNENGWRRNWETDWDDEYSDAENWLSNVDYIMGADGQLQDPAGPRNTRIDTNNSDGRYEYHGGASADSIQRSIDEKERQLEQQRRQLEELRNTQDRKRGEESPEAPEPEARQNYAPVPNAMISLI
jgi:phage shock protein PspC (stress-responsive transcriptional regulator)